jgi:hypothetical protein
MALPGVRQTFAIEDASGMIEKLNWEIAEFAKECDFQQKLWRGFNCAVTAWHVTDWSWRGLKAKNQLQPPSLKLDKYQQMIANQCRSLGICKSIANASKHSGANKPDVSVEVVVVPATEEPMEDWLEIQKSQHWRLEVHDDGKPIDALLVFYRAAKFWDDWLFEQEKASDPERFKG